MDRAWVCVQLKSQLTTLFFAQLFFTQLQVGLIQQVSHLSGCMAGLSIAEGN